MPNKGDRSGTGLHGELYPLLDALEYAETWVVPLDGRSWPQMQRAAYYYTQSRGSLCTALLSNSKDQVIYVCLDTARQPGHPPRAAAAVSFADTYGKVAPLPGSRAHDLNEAADG